MPGLQERCQRRPRRQAEGLGGAGAPKTNEGKELVRIMDEIARGKLVIEKTYFDKEGKEHTSSEQPSHRDRIAAVEWLADRGFGKCVISLEHSGLNGGPILTAESTSVEDIERDLVAIGAMTKDAILNLCASQTKSSC